MAMTRAEKIERLKLLLDIQGTDEDALIDAYFDRAENAIMTRAFPFDGWPVDDSGNPIPFLQRYDQLSIEAAESFYARAGSEGETGHSENGISRSYATDGLPKSIVGCIVPQAKAAR
jgi:hypothetical protein